jgi:hypothetical protein
MLYHSVEQQNDPRCWTGRKPSQLSLGYCPAFARRDWGKPQNTSHDNPTPGQDLNPRLSGYEAYMVTTRPPCSVCACLRTISRIHLNNTDCHFQTWIPRFALKQNGVGRRHGRYMAPSSFCIKRHHSTESSRPAIGLIFIQSKKELFSASSERWLYHCVLAVCADAAEGVPPVPQCLESPDLQASLIPVTLKIYYDVKFSWGEMFYLHCVTYFLYSDGSRGPPILIIFQALLSRCSQPFKYKKSRFNAHVS